MLARPSRSQIASTTDSSTVKPGNSVLIWNVRVMPALDARELRHCVIRSSSKKTSPALGGSAPVSKLMNVVLPAPLGPINACRAPGVKVRLMSLFALNAPHCLDSFSVR
jgi:hypothetical protein